MKNLLDTLFEVGLIAAAAAAPNSKEAQIGVAAARHAKALLERLASGQKITDEELVMPGLDEVWISVPHVRT